MIGKIITFYRNKADKIPFKMSVNQEKLQEKCIICDTKLGFIGGIVQRMSFKNIYVSLINTL